MGLLFLLGLIACSSTEPNKVTSVGVEKAAVMQYQPIKAEEWRLDNGLTVLFYRDPELPVSLAIDEALASVVAGKSSCRFFLCRAHWITSPGVEMKCLSKTLRNSRTLPGQL